MKELTGTVAAGPVARGSGLPQYVDVFGQRSVGGRGHWVFREANPARPRLMPGEPAPAADPIYRLRRGWGVNESGLIIVGVALGLARRRDIGASGARLLRRTGVDPANDILVTPEFVQACRPLHDVPLALVVTLAADADRPDERFLSELAATGWSVALATMPVPLGRAGDATTVGTRAGAR